VAASLSVEVRDARGTLVKDASVWAVPAEKRPLPPPRPAVMDQRNRAFVPHVLVVQTGAAVRFPNSDNVRHQVYSFAPAKHFQLPLYSGTPAAPVVFDRPGVVPLGCNIHDRMSAFIVVVDTPYFAVAPRGAVELADLPAGAYLVHAWHEGDGDPPPPQSVTLATSERATVRVTLGGR
jgi:plastocyanin